MNHNEFHILYEDTIEQAKMMLRDKNCKMEYNELYRLLVNDEIVILYDNKYSYVFMKKIVANILCVKMMKYRGHVLDNDKVYMFCETLYEEPTKEIAKILDNTKVLAVFRKVGVIWHLVWYGSFLENIKML